MRYFLSLLVALLPIFSWAQLGHYFLSHYTPGDEKVDRVAFDIAQGDDGYLYFATRSGILTFDGRNWELIKGNTAIYSIEIANNHGIYWGGASGFGKLYTRDDGTHEMVFLSGKSRPDIYQTLAVKDQLYFLSDEEIYTVDSRDSVKVIESTPQSGEFTYLFELSGRPFVSTDRAQLYELSGHDLKLADFSGGDGHVLTFSSSLQGEYIVGTADNQLLLLKGQRFTKIDLVEDSYVSASVVIGGVWVNSNLVALATLRGGVIFLNPRSGKIEEIVNYHTGLPDNEILALMGDRDNNIWVAHEYGFSRIEPFHPFRSFSHYEGLKGNLLCAKTFGETVYVGTSLGLYKLSQEAQYDEIVFYQDSIEMVAIADKPAEQPPVATNEVAEIPTEPLPDQTEPEKKRKGFLRFLKRNRDKIEEVKAPEAEQAPSSEQTGNEPVQSGEQERYIIHKIKKTERLLRSAQFVYQKVEGIETKISHLVESNGRLLAGGLGGVYEIEDKKSIAVLEEPVRYIFSVSDQTLLVSTYVDEVHYLKYEEGNWRPVQKPTTYEDQVSYAFEDDRSRLWLCGLDNIYVLEGLSQSKVLTIPNPHFSKTIGFATGNQVILANESGIYRYEESTGSLGRVDSLRAPSHYFSTASCLLLSEELSWYAVGQSPNDNLEMLSVIPEIRFVDSNGQQNNLWLITEDNELYKFYGDRLAVYAAKFPLVLKAVTVGEQKVAIGTNVKIDQQDGVVRFDIVQPAYTRADATQYRYFVKGITESWTDWSRSNSSIDFPFLPVGTYTLQVQARDIFGNITEMDPFRFEVQPPFWKRPWFYAMEFSVFSLLVLLSFKLSVRYRFVSRLLTLLTIILLIEFIQTLAGSALTTHSSPIIDFIIQVLVAFLILPVEGYLRDLMLRSMGSGSKLYDVISDLNKSRKKK